MSQHIKHATATLTAAALLAFASTVRAAEPAEDFQTVAADSPIAVCHPAYRPCRKEAKAPTTLSSVSAETAYTANGEFDHVAFGSACHPAYLPCANGSKSK